MSRPNIVFFLADDMGYGDLSSYGQTAFETPNIDQLAKDGVRFTNAYAGSCVCGPSRSVLMTGKHTGNNVVRNNNGKIEIPDGVTTLADVLRSGGYRTVMVGKWGLGDHPLTQGWDDFYGYLTHMHAHNFYPDYLHRQDVKETLEANAKPMALLKCSVDKDSCDWGEDKLLGEVMSKLDDLVNQEPFFLYYSFITPHAGGIGTNVETGIPVPDSRLVEALSEYRFHDQEYASAIIALDEAIGMVMTKISSLGMLNNTLVIFSSDNGPHVEGFHHLKAFGSGGPFHGYKRSLSEGGVRVPMIAHWPGTIQPNQVRDDIVGFVDMIPTLATLANVSSASPVFPLSLDGIDISPLLLDPLETVDGNRTIYNEFCSPNEFGEQSSWNSFKQLFGFGFGQTIRVGDLKLVCVGETADTIPPCEAPLLFNLTADPGEETNLASSHPNEVADLFQALKSHHSGDANCRPNAAGLWTSVFGPVFLGLAVITFCILHHRRRQRTADLSEKTQLSYTVDATEEPKGKCNKKMWLKRSSLVLLLLFLTFWVIIFILSYAI